MAAAIENHDHFVIPGGCYGMIRRVYLVERLAAGTAPCGKGADETTLRRLSRQLKQQWWRAEDVKLWAWLGELVEKAGATGQEPGFRLVSSQASLSSTGMWPSGTRLPTWEPLPKPGCASGFWSPLCFSFPVLKVRWQVGDVRTVTFKCTMGRPVNWSARFPP